MRDLPVASGAAHVKAFQRAGFELLRRRGRDKHFLLRKAGLPFILSIPDHREVKRGLLYAQVKNAGLTVEEYVAYFRD